MVLMKIRAFLFMDGPNGGRTLDLLPRGDVKRMLDRDGKELAIGKTYLDNVLRAMTEGGT